MISPKCHMHKGYYLILKVVVFYLGREMFLKAHFEVFQVFLFICAISLALAHVVFKE